MTKKPEKGKKVLLGNKKQICFTVTDDILKELLEISQNTDIQISTQIECLLKGYTIKKTQTPTSP